MANTNLVTDNEKPIKLSEDRLVELGDEIVRMIDAGRTSVDGLRDRWKRNEDLYYMRPYERSAAESEDASKFATPLMRAKADSLVATMATLITESDPYFIYKTFGPKTASTDIVQKSVHFLLKLADFERHLKLHLKLTSINGKACIRSSFKVRAKGFHADQESTSSYSGVGLTTDKIAYCGPELKVVHVGDMVIYPVESAEIVDARLVGSMYWLRREEIEALQATKEYLDHEKEFSTSTKSSEISGRDASYDLIASDTNTFPEDGLVQCYSCIVKLDLDDKEHESLYEVNIAYANRAVLSIKRFEYDRPWYYAPTLDDEYNSWYPSGSVCQNLQGLQLMQNELLGVYYDGTMSRAFPPTFVNDEGGRMTDGYEDMKFGRAYATQGKPDIAVVQSQFDPSTFNIMLGMIDTWAEEVGAVSRSSSTQPYRKGTTATEVSAIQQAGAISGNSYLANYTGSELCALADHIRQMAYDNFEILKIVYGDQFPANTRDELLGGGIWEVAARSPSRTPMGQQQAAMNLIALYGQTQTPHINIEELIKSVVMNSDLPNKETIFVSSDEIIAQQQGNPALGGAGNGLLAGMGGPQGLPPGIGGPPGGGTGEIGPTDGFGEDGSGAGGYGSLAPAVG